MVTNHCCNAGCADCVALPVTGRSDMLYKAALSCQKGMPACGILISDTLLHTRYTTYLGKIPASRCWPLVQGFQADCGRELLWATECFRIDPTILCRVMSDITRNGDHTFFARHNHAYGRCVCTLRPSTGMIHCEYYF